MSDIRHSILLACTALFLGSSGPVCFARRSAPEELPGKETVKEAMRKVADWQIAEFAYPETGSPGHLHDHGIAAWPNATLYLGMLEWARIAGNMKYNEWLYGIGAKTGWQIPSNLAGYPAYGLYHADELCIGQFYLGMYHIYKEEKMLDATKTRADYIINNPPDTSMNHRNKQVWTWCDALFMAPPVFLHVGILTGETAYADFMNTRFKDTYRHLYNTKERLFFRDDSYFDKREANGEKVFWGRGNGWVVAGIANILKLLPEDAPERAFYEELLSGLLTRLVELQDESGFWHASLLDPASYPAPETSATALITYALAYGINNNLIDGKTFYAPMWKGWQALVSAVDANGKPGWIQPIGANPQKVDKDATAAYGVGAFLYAGTEIYKLTNTPETHESIH